MLQYCKNDVGGILGGGGFFLFGALVVDGAAIPFCHIIAGGPGFKRALPHATWLGAAAAGRKPQTHLSLELKDLFPHVSLYAMPGH